MPHPWLIVGGGIAGTLVGWEFLKRGIPFILADPEKKDTSSKVAAGVINPITGPRLRLTWGIPDQLTLAEQTYADIGKILGSHYYHTTGMLRICEGDQSKRYQSPVESSRLTPYGVPLDATTSPDPNLVATFETGFYLPRAGFLEVERFITDSHAYFRAHSSFVSRQIDLNEISLQPSSITWDGTTFSGVILCSGFEAAHQRWFDWLPFRSAKGEVIDLTLKSPPSPYIINRSANWLLPPVNGISRAGSTYCWDELNSTPTEGARESILSEVENTLTSSASPAVIAHRAAVRPVIHGRRPVVGSHPSIENVAILNGLGSKGILHAPYCVEQLINHLIDGNPISSEVSVLRNF